MSKKLFYMFLLLSSQLVIASEILLVSSHGQGGGIHKHALQVQTLLTEWLNEPVILEFKPGGNGIVGTQYVRARVSTKPTFMIGALQYEFAMDQSQDIVPVVELGVLNPVIYASPKLGVKSWSELIGSRQSVSYGVPIGGPLIYMDGLAKHLQHQIQLREVSYKSSGQMTTDVIGGHLDLGTGTPNVIAPLAATDKVIPLLVLGNRRSSVLPNIPCIADLGIAFPNDRYKFRTMLWASPSTDVNVIESIRRNYIRWVTSAEGQRVLDSLDYDIPSKQGLTQPADMIKKLVR